MQTEEGSWTPHGGYNLSGQKRTTFERRFSPLHLRNGPARQCTGYSMKTLAHINDKCRIELSQMQAVMKSDHERAAESHSFTIDRHFAILRSLEHKAGLCFERGEMELSAAWIQLAGQYAWFHPAGVLASWDLETILAKLSRMLGPDRRARKRERVAAPRKILHVLSEVYALGGHTRLVWRWIRADALRMHSVALTRQMESDVPEPLKFAVEATGGRIHFLDRRGGGLLARARELRSLAGEFDHVVVHTHPWDVTPPIAFTADQERPPLTLMNKDDHVFWLGAAMADQVAQMRPAGSLLCQERRGIPASRCRMLPLPLEVPQEPMRRQEARQALGIAGDVPVLLSVASPYKYETAGEHFTGALLPLLHEFPKAILFVIGPEARGLWQSAADQCGGRLRAVGRRGDAETFYRAADIYLDSFPLNSLTSALEAGIHGKPIVSYFPYSAEAGVLLSDDIALNGVSFPARDAGQYREALRELISDPQLRLQRGQKTRESIIELHTGRGWARFVEDLYADVPRNRESDAPQPAERRVTELESVLTGIYAAAGLSRGLKQDIRNHLALFPLKARLALWANEFGCNIRMLPSCILSDGQKTMLRLFRMRLAKAGRKWTKARTTVSGKSGASRTGIFSDPSDAPIARRQA